MTELPVYRAVNAEACERLLQASLGVLGTVGVEVRHDRGMNLLRRAGAQTEGSRVRIPAALVDQALDSAPHVIELPGRASDHSLDLDLRPGATYFGNGTDCMFAHDTVTGQRRRAVLADVEAMAAACERLPNIDFVMSGFLPSDSPMDTVDLAQFAAVAKYTRKPIVISSPRAGDTLMIMREMAGLAGNERSFACLAMTSPPLILDFACVDKALVCAEFGVPFICAPGSQMGATGPASIAGSLVIGIAETLAGIVLHQLAKPGGPCVFGVGAGSALDMRTMVDVWTSPEATMSFAIGCQLATLLGLPSWSFGGTSESKILDGQWASEVSITALMSALSGATLIHDLGEYESGMQNSVEAVVFGDAVVSYVRRLLAGAHVTDETLQLADIAEVGPGGHFLSRPYTRANYSNTWKSALFDTSDHRSWSQSGGRTLRDRLGDVAGQLRADASLVLDQGTARQVDSLQAE